MKKESSQAKSVEAVKRHSMMVCPHCGNEDFERKEGFSLLGQQFICAKCKGTFRKANVVRAKTTSIQVDKKSSAAGPGGRKHGTRRHGRR